MRRKGIRTVSIAAGFALAAAGSLSAQATFDKLVAVGDSLPAGMQSNCLVERLQNRSATAILAEQLGVADFQQPLIQEVAATDPPTSYPCLGAVVANSAISVGIVSQEGPTLNAALARPYDNLGMNGGPRMRDIVNLRTSVPGRSDLDNYAARILRNIAGTPFEGRNAAELAASLNPDLVLYWVGNNDVLGAATRAVAIDGVTLTPVASFEADYNSGLNSVRSGGATIVTFTIPDVASIPFTTTVPPFVVNPADGSRIPLLGPGNDAYPCPSAAPCALPEGTLVTLPAASQIRSGIGVPAPGGTGLPLEDGSFTTTPAPMLTAGVLLYPNEVAAIRSRTNELNSVITAASASAGAVLVDVHRRFQEIQTEGYEIGGLTLTSDFLTGGIFSADGVHPSAIGYALLADEIIQRLNEETGSEIPRPNLAQALFTPNESPFSPFASASGFNPEVWSHILRNFPPVADGIKTEMSSEWPQRSTRVIRR